MERMKSEFNYATPAQAVYFGQGRLTQLGAMVAGLGWKRLLLCTSPSLRAGGHVATLEQALGERLVAIYDRTQSHVLDYQRAEALTIARAQDIDAVIGLGGGSPIGLAKAVSWAFEENRAGPISSFTQPRVPVIAIPSTYAGSEMTPVFGVTHTTETPARKVTVKDGRIAPRLVVYDSNLTRSLPAQLTAGTGINALAHCIEAIYSTTRNPLSSASALEGIRLIARALPRCVENGADMEAREMMLRGAHLGGAALASASMALHHGLCHVLGGSAGVGHGTANAIILPHAMRFNLQVATTELARVAEALGAVTPTSTQTDMALAAIEYVDELIRRVGLPQKLREVGVHETALPDLARLALNNSAVKNNPRPATEVELEAIFRAAY